VKGEFSVLELEGSENKLSTFCSENLNKVMNSLGIVCCLVSSGNSALLDNAQEC